ncbi:MAG: hypothetical protein M3N95_07755 [Actinomycetota bacterium]|nr:hypothetical protein [Actinomycetota bacterium]
MNPDIEARVRVALNAKSATIGEHLLRPGNAPTDADELNVAQLRPMTFHRGLKMSVPLLAAAAVVALIAAGAALVSSPTSRARPGQTPSPTVQITQPSPSISATPSPTSSVPTTHPSTASTTAVQPVPPVSVTTAPPTPVVYGYAGVGITLPGTWTQATAPSTFSLGGVCLSRISGGCELYVHRGEPTDAGQVIDWSIAGTCGPSQTTPTSYGQRTIDGQVAEYRTFAAGCGQPASEQWFIPTDPQIEFWHPLGSSDALIEQAVRGASLPKPAGPLPQRDRAYILSMTQQADGYHVTMQRMVGLVTGPVAEPGATYKFVIPPHNDLSLPITCSEWKIPDYKPYQACALSNLVAQSAKGPHPSDGTLPINTVPIIIWTDGASVNTFVTADTFPGGV